MIQVELESGVPKYVVFSQHDFEGKRFWQDVEILDETHPVVYVARGSHASYFKPYRHGLDLLDPPDVTAMRSSQPIAFTMLSTTTAWLDFEGHWGKWNDDINPLNDGPRGPKFQGAKWVDPSSYTLGDKWINPISYTQKATWDELNLLSQGGKFRPSIDSTDNFPKHNDVHVYKKIFGQGPREGPHVGWNNGVIELEIDDAEYFDNPEAMRRTIILHNVLHGSLFYRVETQYRPASQSLHQLTAVESTETLNLTLNYPDLEAGAVITSTYAVSRAWGISSTTFISVHHGSDFYLNMDVDGDGVFEESVPPTTLEQASYDSTAPAPITDLAVLTSTNDSVVLTWSATGDDGNTGTASGYDIRYYTNPLTNSNWVSATMVISPPVPSVAGATEVVTVTNMPSGEFYFALQAVDDMLYYSELSNVVQAEIPKRYVYLPLVLRHN